MTLRLNFQNKPPESRTQNKTDSLFDRLAQFDRNKFRQIDSVKPIGAKYFGIEETRFITNLCRVKCLSNPFIKT
jgi:hypothetical protein